MLTRCELCPRRCGANREADQKGFCGAGRSTQIFRYAPHYGEEPPISGTGGSGTIFFSRCTLSCLYCQNYPWSQQGQGNVYDAEQFDHALKALADHGCHNWNFVSPTPWLPHMHAALHRVAAEGYTLPVVYNTSGYERAETLQRYAEDIQIYLTDLRYSKETTAMLGSQARDYVENARSALCAMWNRLGPLQCDENGVALSGVICRLLILPGYSEEVVENLEWLSATLGTTVPVSVMAQYHPVYRAVTREPWNREVSRAEYDRVCQAVDTLGFETGWIQDLNDKTESGLLGHTMVSGGFDMC